MKTKTLFVCNNCSFESNKWLGKCPNCSEWNTFEEKTIAPKNPAQSISQANRSIESVETFGEILIKNQNVEESFLAFNTEILNSFWNKGLNRGSLTLLAGEPGLGKSTLSLQLLRSLILANLKLKCLYVSAEESSKEVAFRSKRLNIPTDILILQTNLFETVEEQILAISPEVVILDSIQTVFSGQINSSPGSVSQVAGITNSLLFLAKKYQIAIILIGHVTKDGQIAGPKTLEHIVDSVLYLESSPSNFRTLSFSKHRYGTTDNQLLMKMTETGLEVITDPSLAILGNFEQGIGIAYASVVEKNLPLLVEVQALVVATSNAFGKRESQGISLSRLNIILGVLQKYLHLDFSKYDVYVQLLGNLPKITDFNLDLALLLSLYASLKNQTVNQILKLPETQKLVFAGRVTLSGKLRQPGENTNRTKVVKKLGLVYNPKITFASIVDVFL